MNKLFNQSAFLLLMTYCFFNLFNVMWLKLNISGLIYWVVLCASFFVLRKLHTYASNGFRLPQSELLALFLLFLTFMAVMAQHLFVNGYVSEIDLNVTTKTFEFWGISALWMIVGGACSTFKIRENTTVSIVILLLMALAFSRGLNDELMISWADVRSEAELSNMSHLGMELFVILPLALAYSISRKTQWFVAICGVFFFYAMGGRASLIMFIATVVFLALRNNPVRNMLALGVATLIVWSGAAYLITYINIDIDNKFVREMLFMGGVQEDGSFQARLNYLQLNISNFTDQFLFGNPTLFVRQNGGMGGYIHNLLSAWEFYGFFSFMAFILLLVYCYRRMVSTLKQEKTPMNIFGGFLLIYVIGSVIIAKSVLWVLLWFVLGFWLLKPFAKSRRRRSRLKRHRRVHISPTQV